MFHILLFGMTVKINNAEEWKQGDVIMLSLNF